MPKPSHLTDVRECRAEFLFYAPAPSGHTSPDKVLGDYTCDCRRPDWEQRWNDWKSKRNPYLNLFLCREHAKRLGLLH